MTRAGWTGDGLHAGCQRSGPTLAVMPVPDTAWTAISSICAVFGGKPGESLTSASLI